MVSAAKRVNGKPAQAVNNQPRLRTRVVLNDQTQVSRASLMRLLMDGQLPPIDIDAECHYPQTLTTMDYQRMYERFGVAKRVVSVYPEECWQNEPDIYETEDLEDETDFEEDWEDMKERLNILSHLFNVDEMSGIGEYGVLLLGFDDGLDPIKPVAGIRDDGTRDARHKALKLNFVRPLSQSYVNIIRTELNPKNPRFGQPTEYQIIFSDMSSTVETTAESMSVVPVPSRTMNVHWTRIQHVADNCKDSVILGVPRQRPVYNRLYDMKKILGANGQGYWQGGFPGLSIETQTGIEAPEFDIPKTKEQVQGYLNSQQRAIYLDGLSARSLAVQIADPGPHYETHLEDVCVAISVPMRIFKGTEEAKLASSQDQRTWNKRVARRQNLYVTPFIIKPFLERMFLVGALRHPQKLFVKWPDLNAPTDNDRATNTQKITDALFKYVTGNISAAMPLKEYLIRVVGFSQDVANQIVKKLGDDGKGLKDLLKVATTIPPKPSAAGKAGKTKKQRVGEGAGANR